MDTVATAPALGISVQCAAGPATQVVFQTHVPQETSKQELDALVDKLTAVAQRQQAKVDVVDLKKNLKVNTDQLERMRADRARIESTVVQQSDRRLPTKRDEQALAQQRAQADATEKKYAEIISDIRQQITEAEALIKAEG